MKALRVVLTVLAGAVGFGADAQTPSAFENQATSMAADCLAAQNATPEAANAAVAICEKLLSDMDALRQANPSMSGHDLNVFLIVKGMGEARVGRSFGEIDGVRSARVCNRMEREWILISQVKPAQSPGYAALIDTLVGSTITTVGKCRQEFGAPAGAIPLPG